MVILYHGPLFIHWLSCTSISDLRWFLFSVIHYNPTYWNIIWITKVIIILFNYSFFNWYVAFLSKLFHLMHINLSSQPFPYQIIIENIWNTLNNEWKYILSPFAWKFACSKMHWNWNYSILLSSHLGQFSAFMLRDNYFF